ncbi:MAG: hypothetical protein IKV73_00760, partial [Clostridia bacterium]|nr:hypothetical protein [Clostridia bacterium]
MLKKTVLAVLLIIALTSLQVIAASVPQVQFDTENLSLDLKWDASGITDKLITVTVSDSDASLSADNCPDFAWVYEMPNDKQVDLDILLPAEIKSGTCYIYVDTKNEHHKLTSYVHNILSDTTKSICSDAYAINDVEDFELYAASNAAYLGLDTDNKIISANLERATNLLYYEMSRHQSKTPLNINNSAKAVTGFILLGDSANIDDTVNSYAEVLEIDSAAFAARPTAVKNKFSQLVASKSNDQSDIKSIVSDCIILASLTVAENW